MDFPLTTSTSRAGDAEIPKYTSQHSKDDVLCSLRVSEAVVIKK